MSFSSRIFGMIEMELSKQLGFTVTLQAIQHKLGTDPRRIAVGDTIRIRISVRNNADFKIRSIRGGLVPSPHVDFRPVNFRIAELPPASGADIATLEARVVSLPERGALMDQIATISLSAGADLSNLVFQEWDKPVVFVTRSGQLPASRTGVVMGSSRTQSRAASIPLSGIPLSESG